MNENFIFFTSDQGEELGGTHYDFDRMCEAIETFISTNKEREFLFISACQKTEDGTIREMVRWERGSLIPVLDLRKKSCQDWATDHRGRVY